MSNLITSAAPMVIDLGTKDSSKKSVNLSVQPIPQHLPKIYIYAEKGDEEPTFTANTSALGLKYGKKTLSVSDEYYNHSTAFLDGIMSQGNACMVERIVPEDAKPNANLTLWLDVLPTNVDIYSRNTDGSIKTDSEGVPIIVSTAPGFKVKIVKTFREIEADYLAFGSHTIRAGDQLDPTTNVQSQRYPLFESAIGYKGKSGNNIGFRLWAPVDDGFTSIPRTLIDSEKVYPFNIQVIEKEAKYINPSVIQSSLGSEYITFTLKPNSLDPLTDGRMYMSEVFPISYDLDADNGIRSDIRRIAIYQNHIETLLTMFHAAESAYVLEPWTDFTDDPEEKFLFNILSGVNTKGAPYHTFHLVDAENAIRPTKYTNIYHDGSSDGTMDDTSFAAEVSRRVSEYANPMSRLMDLAKYPESIIYDSGFPMATKKDLAKFIAIRKNTAVAISTFTAGQRDLTPEEEYSAGQAIKTYLQLFTESDYFGTPVTRAIIMSGSGDAATLAYKKRVPVLLEIAMKSAGYMGSSSGKWVTGKSFDSAPGSGVRFIKNPSITWVPNSVRTKYWSVGINFILNNGIREQFIPAIKTVYDDDTSVLNSFFTIMAICTLNSIAHGAWRTFTGSVDKTPGQLEEAVNNYVNKEVQDIFDGRYAIRPAAKVTEQDLARGFSWTLPIKLGAPNMTTVMTTYTDAFRIQDLLNE